MKGIVRRIDLAGPMVLHEVGENRYAIEIGGVNLKMLICDAVRVGLKDEDGTKSWGLGPAVMSIGPMKGVEDILNPEIPVHETASRARGKRQSRRKANGR